MKKIGLLCAGDVELEPFLHHIENAVLIKKAMLTFYVGKISGISVVALYSGVGKVNADIASQIIIDNFYVDAIINAGTAAGVDKTINLFDTIISTQIAYHDVDDGILTEFHHWLPSIYFDTDEFLLHTAKQVASKFQNVYFGRMVTGEVFEKKDFDIAESPILRDFLML